ncbi:uncharacterized protein LOC117287879 [Asterias rubens]|uniref:uncharacterized protein LOC117287879 n=1 Tax=Asterias rubens TaxID=7604 RepID=UPI00145591EC|nr:uncharacterized protein LOC117287879 [Asterias rubens]
MDTHDEESQDVDLIILADSAQSAKEVGEKDRNLPHFQFTDGKGRLQNSIDSPREGFIALKITYMHVFKKQQEHAKALQQKNQKLVAEIQQLKKQSDLSWSQEQVSPCDSEVQTELVDLCSDKENSDLDFQLALLKEQKSKLWSGFIYMAKYLLKREPLSSLPQKVLDNLQSLDCDSEESVKELEHLVQVMSGLDDELSQLPTKDEASGNRQPSDNHSNLSDKLNKSSPPKLVTGCQTKSQCDRTQPQTKDLESMIQQKPEAHKHGKDVAVDIQTSQEEDMYGVEGNEGDQDLVPYNLMRLRQKLIKLQSFPVEYGTMIQNLNDNLEQQKTTSLFKVDPHSHQRKSCTELSAEPNVSGDISSFIQLHNIKVPPLDFPQTLRNSDDLQNGLNVQEGLSNTSPVKLDSPKGTFPFEVVRGPPNTSQFSPLGANRLSEWQPSAVASVCQPPPRATSNMVEKGNNEHLMLIQGTSEAHYQLPEQLYRSNNKESIANSAPKPRSYGQDERSKTMSVVIGPSSSGPCMPGSDTDELVTARGSMSENNVTSWKMECPVCKQNFSPSTTEAEVNSHVNFHFEGTSLDDLGYDILNPC